MEGCRGRMTAKATPATPRRLRVAHILIQPVLVWDDGNEITPGPPVQTNQLPVSELINFVATLPSEVARIETELLRAESVESTSQPPATLPATPPATPKPSTSRNGKVNHAKS